MLKKRSLACLAIVALALSLACKGKTPAAAPASPTGPAAQISEPAQSPPQATNIDSSKSGEIDALLDKYAEVVDKYLKDSAQGGKADDADLGEVSSKLSDLAKDFDADQLKRYNEITAKLSGE
jgi:hypothetical protein